MTKDFSWTIVMPTHRRAGSSTDVSPPLPISQTSLTPFENATFHRPTGNVDVDVVGDCSLSLLGANPLGNVMARTSTMQRTMTKTPGEMRRWTQRRRSAFWG